MPFSTKQNEAENCWHITIKKQITQFLGIKTFNISTKDKYHNFVRSTTAPEYSFLLYNGSKQKTTFFWYNGNYLVDQLFNVKNRVRSLVDNFLFFIVIYLILFKLE